jgi:Cys-rich protein (TIGR01571 family)
MPGTTQKSYADHDYNVGASYDKRDQGHHNSYPHPDSPSNFSQLTTATRREEEEDDPDAPVIIRVVAPATLREGYTMDVLYDDQPYTIEIPRGGVEEGQEFETIIDPKQTYKFQNTGNSFRRGQMEQLAEEENRDDSRTQEYTKEKQSRRSGGSNGSSSYHRKQEEQQYHIQQHKARIYDNGSEFTVNDDQSEIEKPGDIKQTHTYPSIEEDENKEYKATDEKTEDTIWYDDNGTPIGGWRTRLYGCCDVLTQSTFWMGFFCAPVLMAQIITRMKLTWNGREGPPEETSLSFNRIVLSLVFTMGVFWVPVMGSICMIAYYLAVIVYIGSHVRAYMRLRYKIPSTLPTRCGDRVDDVCMMLFCGCCSTIQMARHTHDDKEYPGFACTTNGLEFDAPEIV